MPDENGKLTDADIKEFLKWVQEHPDVDGVHCPICAVKDWNLHPQLVTMIPVDAKNAPSNGKTAVGVSATCTRCGFILTVSAHTVGILKRIDQP